MGATQEWQKKRIIIFAFPRTCVLSNMFLEKTYVLTFLIFGFSMQILTFSQAWYDEINEHFAHFLDVVMF